MKIEIQIKRHSRTTEYTHGKLYINSQEFCDTLEDAVRTTVKVYGKTAIPAGEYKVALTHSPRFGRVMPEVLDVPDFTGVRIHPGNTVEDTEGCILVGVYKQPAFIANSRDTYKKLMDVLSNKDVDEITLKIS